MRTHGSICAGIGGLDLAVNAVFGTQTSWMVEFDKHASKVLDVRFPGVPNLGDLTKIDWTQVEPVYVMSGGTPCQDLSHAGRRAGMREGTRSGLWESMREGIAILRPQYVVWENVKGALSAKASSDVERVEGRVGGLRALGRVLGDLASLGYDARWGVVRASDAGAPHRRERVFVLAHAPADANGLAAGQRPGTDFVDRASEPAQAQLATALPLSRPGPADGDDEAGTYGTYRNAIQAWEALTRPAPEPLRNGRLNPAFSEWVMGFPVGWATGIEGLSDSELLKMFGNAVSPQQAELALRTLIGEGT